MKPILFCLIVLIVLAACSPTSAPVTYNPPTPSLANYAPTIFALDMGGQASASRMNDPRPNIIVILTDDQPYHTVDYMPTVKGELMAKGITFENGFVTTPLCCPSRVSILTGEYVHNHEVYTNRMPLGGAPKFDDTSCVATWLHDGGYRTAYIGKYLNDYDSLKPYGVVPPGWDDWQVFLSKNIHADDDIGGMQFYFDFNLSENGESVLYPKSKANYGADVVTNRALNFIRDSRDEPFFMLVGYYNPHAPYAPAPRHRETFREGDKRDWTPYRPPNFNEEDVSDKPHYVQDTAAITPADADVTHKQILRSLLAVDDGVASILNALESAGLDQNTIVVYLSDNGLTLGEHRSFAGKNCAYEACVKVPFIVYAPGMYSQRADTHLVANIDLAPTIADWAGIAIPDSVDGISLIPILDDPSALWRSDLLLEHFPTEEGGGALIPEFYAIRTAEWKYVEYATGETELYDLIRDPFELQNAAGRSEYQDVQASLALKLQELKNE